MKLRVTGAAAIALYLVLVVSHLRTLLPWCDEGWFSDPALNLMTRGVIANTVLDPTAAWRQVRLDRIDQHAYWILPLYVDAQAGWYTLVGFGLFSMRAPSCARGHLCLRRCRTRSFSEHGESTSRRMRNCS